MYDRTVPHTQNLVGTGNQSKCCEARMSQSGSGPSAKYDLNSDSVGRAFPAMAAPSEGVTG